MATNTLRKSLLDIVQEILSDMDSDNVNSISDTDEAMQVARIVQYTYYDLIGNRRFPELDHLTTLHSLTDDTRPTYFRIPDRTSKVISFEYNVSKKQGDVWFRRLLYRSPDEFLSTISPKSRNQGDDTTQEVKDINSNTSFIIRNDRMPTYYTSFDDEFIVCDSFDKTIEDTLQETNTRAFVKTIPDFPLMDDYEPRLNHTHFRLLVSEAKSTALAILLKNVNPKVEQQARRQRIHSQDEYDRIEERTPHRIGYGRN